MTVLASRLPFSLDPLMSEAKRRMRRRRLGAALILAAVSAVVAALAVSYSSGGPQRQSPPVSGQDSELSRADGRLSRAYSVDQVRVAFAAHGVSLYAINRFPANGIVRFVHHAGLEVEGFEDGRLTVVWRPSDARKVSAARHSLR